MLQIEQHNGESKGYFRAVSNGVEAGRMTYSWTGENRIIIDHTEVAPEFKGRNMGKEMLLAAVEFARKNNIKILPLCPFAKSIIQRNPELQDVL
ncbi:MAG TPA: GNAT family N-acetyltransferase [Flavobacteriales bacterium]|jgi:predicted GNAT family acetyltransferase